MAQERRGRHGLVCIGRLAPIDSVPWQVPLPPTGSGPWQALVAANV
ncbi:MAG: hypothetical protein GY696_39350 [Gammaproteobacteria bacterium]|nr:hypothetical protein [Gammaproteobacteria bacterium]